MSVTRREFLVWVPAIGVGSTLVSSWVMKNPPVVSFHLDQPYLDLTGLEKPYVPPAGLRSGASLATLTEEQILSRFYGGLA